MKAGEKTWKKYNYLVEIKWNISSRFHHNEQKYILGEKSLD